MMPGHDVAKDRIAFGPVLCSFTGIFIGLSNLETKR
jgi:hypothetical protein